MIRFNAANNLSKAILMIAMAATFAIGVSAPALADDALRFDTPDAAVQALIDATNSTEKGAVGKIFGSAATELLSGDEVQDKTDLASFTRSLKKAHKLVKNDNGTMTLLVGR